MPSASMCLEGLSLRVNWLLLLLYMPSSAQRQLSTTELGTEIDDESGHYFLGPLAAESATHTTKECAIFFMYEIFKSVQHVAIKFTSHTV